MPNLRAPLEEATLPFATQVIQGAATAVDIRKRKKNSDKPVVQNWQYKAYEYYDEVPEVYYGANFIGNCLARIRLVGAEVAKNLGDPPKESTKKFLTEAVKNFTNTRAGQAGLLRRFGQNMFLAGEIYIHGEVKDDETQNWEVYSTIELKGDNLSGYTLQNQTGGDIINIRRDALITRVWKEHPKRSYDPDSAMKTCSKQCEKLLLLEKQDMSIAKSRFAGAGLLLIPSEIIPTGVVDEEGNIDDDPNHSPFIINIQEAMIAPVIGDEDPADVVPSFITGQSEFLKQIRHLTMEKPLNEHSDSQKTGIVRRMATAMDLPNEVLLGLQDTNHWTAWQIKEETFQTHIRPVVEMICNSITVGYLWPQLKKAGIDNYKDYLIWYDDSNLVARPDKSVAAQKAFEGLALSEEAYLREMGFTEDDAPNEEEFLRRAALAMRYGDGLFLIDGGDDPDYKRGTASKIGGQNNHDAQGPFPQDKSRPDPNLPGPAKSTIPGINTAPEKSSSQGGLQASGSYTLSPQAQGYLEASIDRALEKAGAKVRSIFPKNSEMALYAKNYSNEELYGRLDRGTKGQYNISDDEYLDFTPAIKYLQAENPNKDFDYTQVLDTLRQEAIRKSIASAGNFSLDLDKLDI